jgi:hypothetical protein
MMAFSINVRKRLWAARSSVLRAWHRSDVRVIDGFRIFRPDSAGSYRDLARLTIQAADQTFPLMLHLVDSVGTKVQDPVSIDCFPDTEERRNAAARLKQLLDQYGSDKASPHNYHLLYGAILDPHAVVSVLEIGLGTNDVNIVSNMGRKGRPGASLRALRDFLPDAHIYGADIDRDILFGEDRITTYFVDQTDVSSFDALGAAVREDFDLIIDDGLHSPNANLATLAFGLGRLKIGGSIVIEDIRPEALPLWQVVATLLPSRYRAHVVAAAGGLAFLVHRQD